MAKKLRGARQVLPGFVLALVLGLCLSVLPMADGHAAKPVAKQTGSAKAAEAKRAGKFAKTSDSGNTVHTGKAGHAAKGTRGGAAAAHVRRAASGKVGRVGSGLARNASRAGAMPRGVAGNGLRAGKRSGAVVALVEPARASYGHLYGLQSTDDELDLKSSVALVVDQDTNEVLFSKNPEAVLPIASITKLMTALVVTEAGLPLNENLLVTQADVEATSGSRSRLQLGTELNRGEMLHLALMASENRAAHVLGRNYPGGTAAFVASMNRKARELGMHDTRYVEPTGLSSDNQSSARDLAQLVRAAMHHPIIRELSTSLEASVPVGRRQVQFHNTNGLVRNPEWEIGLQKTGYIAAAGRCVVMQAELAGRKLIMVLLDSAGKYSRIGDAERLRKWLGDNQLVRSLSASTSASTRAMSPAPAMLPTTAAATTLALPAAAPPSLRNPAVPGLPAAAAIQRR